MSSIIPIPSTRVSDTFVRDRLISQVQADQLGLFKLQNQISTGQRITVASDDPSAAMRALTLQGLLLQKQQVITNLSTNQSYLSATDSALSSVSSLLSNVQSAAMAVSDNTSTSDQRQAAAVVVSSALQQMIDVANQQFRGRNLFSGSSTGVQPYQQVGSTVSYNGNNQNLLSYSDSNVLFNTNVPGDQVFGGFSSIVQGSANLNPVLQDSTKLSDLRGGQGIRSGSISISDGTNTSIIDLSSASTIGDVARLINTHPPQGRTLTARVTSSGLTVGIDAAGGGVLTIREVGGGTTASQLGILHVLGNGTAPVVGSPLTPQLSLTTPLANIVGVKASANIVNSGPANDLLFQANQPGADFNGVNVQFVDATKLQANPNLAISHATASYSAVPVAAQAALVLPGATNDLILTANQAGSQYNGVAVNIVDGGALGDAATASYNAGSKTLTLTVDGTGQTSVDTLIAAVNGSTPFTATRDTSAELNNTAGGTVSASAIGNGVANTVNSGSDGKSLLIKVLPGFTTANQVIAAVNADGTFNASLDKSELNNDGSGMVLDSLANPQAVATTAAGSGVAFDQNSGLQIVNGGNTYNISFAGDTTIEDMLNTLNGSGAGIFASINQAGTGIDIQSRLSGGDFSIGENGGQTATQLGVRSLNASTALSQLNYGVGVHTATSGDDFTVHRKDGTDFQVTLNAPIAAAARINGVATGMTTATANSALVFTRVPAGAAGNQFNVQVTDSGSGGGNAVTLNGNTLTFNVDLAAGFTAQQAVSLLQANPTLSQQFTANLDTVTQAGNDGSGKLSATGSVAFSGGAASAGTIGDVLNLINNNATNLASGVPVVARMAAFGNGIELVNDGPAGNDSLSIKEDNFSQAAQDLGFVAVGASTSGSPTAGTVASSTLSMAGTNNDLVISARSPGTMLNGVAVQFVDDGALQAAPGLTAGNEKVTFKTTPTAATTALKFGGANTGLILTANQTGIDFNNVTVSVTSNLAAGPATAAYDPVNKVLNINLMADGSSTASDVVAAIGSDPSHAFSASLDTSSDFTNDGSGTIAAFSNASFANTGNTGGAANTLFINIEKGATTANDIAAALNNDSRFQATLVPADGAPNDGSGLIDTSVTGTISGGKAEVLGGANTNPQEVPGIFTALTRLQTALQTNDLDGISRGLALLDSANSQLSFARAELGARQQALDTMNSRLTDEQTELKSNLSTEIDVDLPTAISDFTARQTAFQASLQVTGLISKLTLLNFL
jgi:flagellar hook-associated protein 3 FlgL